MLMTIALMVIWSPTSFSTDNDVGCQTELVMAMNEEAPVTMPAFNPASLCWDIEGQFDVPEKTATVQEVTYTDKGLIHYTGELSTTTSITLVDRTVKQDTESYLNCSVKFD